MFVRSTIDHAAPIWSPSASKTSIGRLQVVQNKALRAITGCVLRSNIDDLHREAKILRIEDHLNMISTQAVTRYVNPAHPCHFLLQEPSPPRNMKLPAHVKWRSRVPDTASDNIPGAIKEVHNQATTRAINALAPSRLLGQPPPPVHPDEALLPRNKRIMLARARCGQHPALLDFQHKIGRAPSPKCPRCPGLDSVAHRFTQCPALSHQRIGNICLRSLWEDPKGAADFAEVAGLA